MSFHEFRGQRTGGSRGARQGWTSQASDRDIGRSFDQHGRPWAWARDRTTGMPCSFFEPEGWSAPWVPDQGMATMILNPDNTTELFIDYRALVAGRVQTLKEYHGRACKRAAKLGQARPELGTYTEEIVEAEGEPPRSHQFAIACEQGNPWALGFAERPDQRLVPFLETPLRDIEETFEAYDFGAEGYADAAGLPRQRNPNGAERKQPRRYKSFAQLREEQLSGVTAADEVRQFEAQLAASTGATAGEEEEGEFILTDDGGEELLDTTDEPTPTGHETLDPFDPSHLDTVGGEDGDEGDEGDDDLHALEEATDPSAMGGKVFRPGQEDRVLRQAPRRPVAGTAGTTGTAGVSPKSQKPPAATRREVREFSRDGRQTLADGARPAISDTEPT